MTDDAQIAVPPMDEHNEQLVSNVHPPDWVNPEPYSRYNLVVIGAGTAGLVTAAGAAGLGAKVALVERHLMGGDCLNVGCVPSKALIRSARAAAHVRDAHRYGIHPPESTTVDFAAVMERMRRIRSGISKHDSAKRFRELGVDVFLGDARFTGNDAVEVGGKTLRYAKAVIATGARALEPDIPGLAEAGYLTNETVFSLTERPKRMVVIGAGPIGCELAQAFQRLGTQVTLIERTNQILTREDPDAARIVSAAMARDGVEIINGGTVIRVDRTDGAKRVRIDLNVEERLVETDVILIGAGRVPNVEGLGLDAVGVAFNEREGVHIDDTLRTTNPRIFAAGDVCMKHKFTHMADAAARIVIQNALFGFAGKKKLSALTVPWCTYTDPEIAHVGLGEREAAERGLAIDTIRVSMSEVDRAIAEGETDGLLKVYLRKGSGTILGATLVARHAGELIGQITLAMVAGVGLGKISNVIYPYPTQAEIIKKAADTYNRARLTPLVRSVFERVLRWQR
jgi:pyruvate/2-oxoglutarate dehydrogenase complex dihydrolipoamide dehydrogenase (E3) component